MTSKDSSEQPPIVAKPLCTEYFHLAQRHLPADNSFLFHVYYQMYHQGNGAPLKKDDLISFNFML